MKALTIDPEYAWYIHEEAKTIECRTWKTNYRGPLLICTSKMPVPGYISGHAICVVNLVDVVPFTEEHLVGADMDEMPGRPCYAWILDNPLPIIPFPVRGKMGLFDVDEAQIQYRENERTDAMNDDEFTLYADKFTIAYDIPLFFWPDTKEDWYFKALELSKEYRANPKLLYSSDPLPPDLQAALKAAEEAEAEFEEGDEE